MSASFTRRPWTALVCSKPHNNNYGKASGYGGNYSTIRGVSWILDDNVDRSRSTYRNDIDTGYCAPRSFSLTLGKRTKKDAL